MKYTPSITPLRPLPWVMLLVAMLFGGSAAAQSQRPNRPALPAVALARAEHGEAAVAALAGNLPAVALHYGMTAERLTDLLRKDDDLWVDRTGKLFFAESRTPDPANAPAPGDGTSVQAALVPLNQTFLLHSRPSATKKIFLDFDGHTTTGTSWKDIKDGDSTFVTPPYDFDGDSTTFSTAELERIQYIWQRVSEDYAPFDVDVTTEDPGVEGLRKTSTGDVNYGIRVCIGGSSTDWYSTGGYGGVAYIGAFDWNSDTPCYVWENNLGNGNEKYVAEAISHEVGHTLDLYHDGTSTVGYYQGHGTGADGWAPIMGVGYYQPVVQFSRGEYVGANNTEDDLAKITAAYNIPYIADDYGNDFAGASPLSSGTFSVNGLIERNDDVDMFRFDAGAGAFAITVSVDSRSPNLNVEATLYNNQGGVEAVSSPSDTLAALISLNAMAAGTYYLKIDGVGSGDPLNTGYSGYASIGRYSVNGTVPQSGRPIAVASATPSSGAAPLTVQFSSAGSADSNGSIVAYQWTFGDGIGSSTLPNPSYTYPLGGTYNANLLVTDNDGLSDSSGITVTVQGAPTAPSSLAAGAACNPGDPNYAAIALGWQDNSANETLFRLQWSADGVSWPPNPGSGVQEITTTSSTYTHTSLPFATARSYRVRAENGSGASAWSNVASAVTHSVPTVAPSPAASAISSSQVNVTWNLVPNATGYRLERSLNGSTWTILANPAANATSYTDSGLSGGATYYYRMSAAGPCSYFTGPSATVSAATPLGAPAAPSSLTDRAASSSQINLTWRDNATNETGYYVERSVNGTSWALVATLGANATTFASTGLAANTTYYHRVQAFNATGTSAYSNTASTKTKR